MKNKLGVFILLVVTTFVLLYKFVTIPANLAFDEVDFVRVALSLVGTPYQVYSPIATGHSTLYFYILLASIKLLGLSVFSLRLPAVIFGFLSVALFYQIMKLIYKKEAFVIFLTTLMFITMRWFVNFSRFAFEASFLLFLELGSIFFLLLFLQTKTTKHKITYLAATAIMAGLAYQSYLAGRIFFIIPLMMIIINSIQNLKTWTDRIKQPLIFLGIFFIITLPLNTYLFTHHDIRIQQQSYISNSELSLQDKAGFLISNIGSSISMFALSGDPNGRHNYPFKPALNPIFNLFLIAGIIFAFKKRDQNDWLFAGWFAISLIPTIFTYPSENPNMLRAFTVIVPVCYFVSVAIQSILNLEIVKKIKQQQFILGMLFGLVILSSMYEIRTYFIYQSEVFKHSFEIRNGFKSLEKKYTDRLE